MHTCPDCQRPLFEDLIHVCRPVPARDETRYESAARSDELHERSRVDRTAMLRRGMLYADSYLSWELLKAK